MVGSKQMAPNNLSWTSGWYLAGGTIGFPSCIYHGIVGFAMMNSRLLLHVLRRRCGIHPSNLAASGLVWVGGILDVAGMSRWIEKLFLFSEISDGFKLDPTVIGSFQIPLRCSSDVYLDSLVGGLVAIFYFPIYWE